MDEVISASFCTFIAILYVQTRLYHPFPVSRVVCTESFISEGSLGIASILGFTDIARFAHYAAFATQRGHFCLPVKSAIVQFHVLAVVAAGVAVQRMYCVPFYYRKGSLSSTSLSFPKA